MVETPTARWRPVSTPRRGSRSPIRSVCPRVKGAATAALRQHISKVSLSCLHPVIEQAADRPVLTSGWLAIASFPSYIPMLGQTGEPLSTHAHGILSIQLYYLVLECDDKAIQLAPSGEDTFGLRGKRLTLSVKRFFKFTYFHQRGPECVKSNQCR